MIRIEWTSADGGTLKVMLLEGDAIVSEIKETGIPIMEVERVAELLKKDL